MVDACLWDWVGTLRPDNEKLWETLQKSYFELLSQKLGISYGTARETYRTRRPQYATGTETLIALGLQKGDIWNAAKSANTHRFLQRDPKVSNVLSELKDYKHAVLSTMPREVIGRELEAIGLANNTFDALICAEDTEKAKPDKEPFLLAARKLEVLPRDCVMIGDRYEVDIKPAAELGMETILLGTNVKDLSEIPLYVRMLP